MRVDSAAAPLAELVGVGPGQAAGPVPAAVAALVLPVERALRSRRRDSTLQTETG